MRRNIPLGIIIFFLTLSPARAQNLLITEFMAAPVTGEAEWVELCNNGPTTLNLNGWTLEDAASGPVTITDSDLFLAPGSFLVITDALPLGARWQPPSNSLLHLPALPALNNSGDDIRLRNPGGSISDQLAYTSSWLGERGISAERIRFDHGNDASNWGSCRADSGATPGQRNSLSPADYDLALRFVSTRGDSLFISIENAGMQHPEQARLKIWKQLSSETLPQLLRSESFSPPQPGDSMQVRTQLTAVSAGRTPILLVLHCDSDAQAENDSLRISMSIPIPRHTLLVNEIMYEPLATGCEWIECFNTGSAPLDLTGVQIVGPANAQGVRSGVTLPEGLPPVPVSGYAVIAADSTLFSRFPSLLRQDPTHIVILCHRSSLGLGNSGDEIVLLNTDASIIDSIAYDVDWHHPFITSTRGRSLELLHTSLHRQGAQAWSSCTTDEGGTPGRRNSITSSNPEQAHAEDAALQIEPLPFSPDGDGYEDFCVISCSSVQAEYQGRLRIYDATGRCIRTLLNNAPSGSELNIVWDGLDDAGRRARIGPYVALLELLDTKNNTVSIRKGIVVVATRL